MDNLLDGRLATRYLRDTILSLTGRQVKRSPPKGPVMTWTRLLDPVAHDNHHNLHEAQK